MRSFKSNNSQVPAPQDVLSEPALKELIDMEASLSQIKCSFVAVPRFTWRPLQIRLSSLRVRLWPMMTVVVSKHIGLHCQSVHHDIECRSDPGLHMLCNLRIRSRRTLPRTMLRSCRTYWMRWMMMVAQPWPKAGMIFVTSSES